MSQTEIDELQLAEAELAQKLEEIRQKKKVLEIAERERKAKEEADEEAKKPLVIHVSFTGGSSVVTKSRFRQDLLNIWQAVPNRHYRGNEENLIPLGEWLNTVKLLESLNGVTIEYNGDSQKKINWYLNAPNWTIDLDDKLMIVATPGPRTDRWILQSLPAAQWNWEGDGFYKIPLAEGWRVFKILENVQGVIYTDAARTIIFNQIEDRLKLDIIAKKKDTDFITHLGGLPMRNFQKVGVEFGIAANCRVIIGDETGLGKTWQTLAMSEIKRTEATKDGKTYQALCIVKAGNIPNWMREIERLTGEEPVLIKGGELDAHAIHKILVEKKHYTLVSYDTVARYLPQKDEEGKVTEYYQWADIFKMAEYNFLILDEAHQIKNPDTHRFRAIKQLVGIPCVVPATASPVLNNMGEFWSILYMVAPYLFPSRDRFLSQYTVDGRNPTNSKQFQELIRPLFIRRKKLDVIKDMPPINRIPMYLDMSDEGNEKYEEVLEGVFQKVAMWNPSGKDGGYTEIMGILAQITRLIQVCAEESIDAHVELAKGLIADANGSSTAKTLSFTRYKAVARELGDRLGDSCICMVERVNTDKTDDEARFRSLDPTQRDALLESARHDPNIRHIVMVAHPATGVEGHNIEFADWVIFNEPLWGPEAHNQCEGRAYGRISNPHSIDSYYMTVQKEIITWLQNMISEKLNIITEGVDSVEKSRPDYDPSMSITKQLIQKIKDNMWRKG